MRSEALAASLPIVESNKITDHVRRELSSFLCAQTNTIDCSNIYLYRTGVILLSILYINCSSYGVLLQEASLTHIVAGA